MQKSCDSLITTLQKELQEYGALLNLFDRQQQHLLKHDSAGFLEINGQVEVQLENVTRVRTLREALIAEIARAESAAASTSLRDLIPRFPTSRRPLLEALVDEINNLLANTQRRAQQNRLLLARCVESAREMIDAFHPQPAGKTYGATGQVHGFSGSSDHLPAAVA